MTRGGENVDIKNTQEHGLAQSSKPLMRRRSAARSRVDTPAVFTPQTRQMHMPGQNKDVVHHRAGTLPLHTLHLPLVQQHLNSLLYKTRSLGYLAEPLDISAEQGYLNPRVGYLDR